jgi:hypothetical protein
MGRSPGEPAGVDPDEPVDTTADIAESRFRPLKVVGAAQKHMLENVRRALGKLVTHTRVNEIDIDAAGQELVLPEHAVLTVDVPLPVGEVDNLYVSASIHTAGIPQAEPGGGNIDLASVATVVSADSALSEARTQSYALDVAYHESRSFDIPVMQWGVPEPRMDRVGVELAGGEVRAFSLERMQTTVTGSLPVDKLQVRIGSRMSLADASRPMRFAVKNSVSRAYMVPLVRKSSIERRGPGLNMREREKLAAASKIALENVVLIGIFRNVPVTAVSRLSVEEDAAQLSIWLKPEAAALSTPPKLMSLLIGRDTTSGKMIQTVA